MCEKPLQSPASMPVPSPAPCGVAVPFERIRRITGYLVGNLDRFNDAKRAEVAERVAHAR